MWELSKALFTRGIRRRGLRIVGGSRGGRPAKRRRGWPGVMGAFRAVLVGASVLWALVALAPRSARPFFQVVSSVEVSTDEPDARHVESVLAVNPRDPENLVAASIVLGAKEEVAVYASKDGGRTWSRGAGEAGRKVSLDGLDPAVAFDRDGRAFVLADGNTLSVWKSSDSGFTWGAPAVVPGSAWDRPWIGCDAGGTAQSVCVAGKMPVTVFGHAASDILGVSCSSDGGGSFPFPRLFLPAPERDLVNFASDLLVLPDGRLLLALQLFRPENLREATPLQANYATIASSDRGRTFGEPRPGPAFRTFGHAREGKSLFGLSGARLAVDASRGQRSGRIYLTWLDAADGFYRVMAASSTDAGATWSPPVRVDPNESETDASNPVIAVDGRGTVGVAWYDRRADPSDGCYQLFFAASEDGGATFTAGAPVDATRVCPLRRAGSSASVDAVEPVSAEYRFKNGGDTQGVVGLPDGGFQVVWIRPGRSELQLWSTRIVVSPRR